MKTIKLFTADWHLKDPRLRLLQRECVFDDEFDSIYWIFKNLEKRLKINHTKGYKTILYFLGDMFYRDATKGYIDYYVQKIKQLLEKYNATMVMVMGNHDEPHGLEPFLEICGTNSVFEKAFHLEIGGQYFECRHYPCTNVQTDEFALVGHIHGAWKVQPNMINVGVDAWHFHPVTEEQILFTKNAILNHYDKEVFPIQK